MIASVMGNVIFVLVTAAAIGIVAIPLVRSARRRGERDGHQETSSQPR